jgi:hypothetical protein
VGAPSWNAVRACDYARPVLGAREAATREDGREPGALIGVVVLGLPLAYRCSIGLISLRCW